MASESSSVPKSRMWMEDAMSRVMEGEMERAMATVVGGTPAEMRAWRRSMRRSSGREERSVKVVLLGDSHLEDHTVGIIQLPRLGPVFPGGFELEDETARGVGVVLLELDVELGFGELGGVDWEGGTVAWVLAARDVVGDYLS